MLLLFSSSEASKMASSSSSSGEGGGVGIGESEYCIGLGGMLIKFGCFFLLSKLELLIAVQI